MTTTSKYNKSEIMKNAWAILRSGYAFSFSSALKRAWSNAKFTIEYKAREEVRKEIESRATTAIMPDLTNYYRNAPRGTYFGD